MQIGLISFYVKNPINVRLNMAYSYSISVDGFVRSKRRDSTYDRYTSSMTALITSADAENDVHVLCKKLNELRAAGGQTTMSFNYGEKPFGPHISSSSATVAIKEVGRPERISLKVWELNFSVDLGSGYTIDEATETLEKVKVASYSTGKELTSETFIETIDPRGSETFTNGVEVGLADLQTGPMEFNLAKAVLADMVTNVRWNSFQIPSRWENLYLFDETDVTKYAFLEPGIRIQVQRYNVCSLSFSLIEDIS